MKKSILLSVCFLLLAFGSVEAQQAKDAQKVTFSFSERMRMTTIDNAILLNNDADIWTFTRFRTYLGVNYLPFKNLELKMELGNEARVWFSPAVKRSTFDELFVNQLYVKYSNIGGIPLSFTVGRQHLMFDEGFVCLDGQPLTGSRSAYFNAVKAYYAINENNNITAFVAYNTKTDEYLPIIHENDPAQALEEQANAGLGLYYKGNIKKANLSAYYFRKNTFENDAQPIESQINVLGVRGVLPLVNNLKLTAEAAYQMGTAGDFDRMAFGGHFHLDYNSQDIVSFIPQVSLGGFYLSGDDPTTDNVEGWDPLWSRWPKWSESYIYTLIIENQGKVAYWSNISSLHFNVKANVSDKVSFNGGYYRLMAPEDNLSDFCGGNGSVRGDLITMKLNYQIDKRFSGHLLWENFTPGDFYPASADGYNWVRFELLMKI